HVLPVQQSWPAAPHATHEPLEQTSPVLHALPVQQGSLAAPHATHVPPEHTSPVLHVLPGSQHGSVLAPHGTTAICAVAAWTAEVAFPITMKVGAGVLVKGAVAEAFRVRTEVPPVV